jgi:hypothetical protein
MASATVVVDFGFNMGLAEFERSTRCGEVSPATFSVSIETEATFLLFQFGLVGRAIVFSMNA